MNQVVPWLLASVLAPGSIGAGAGEVASVAVGLAGRHGVLDRLHQLGGAGDAPLRWAAAVGCDRLPGRHGSVSRPLVGDCGRDFLAGSDWVEDLAVPGGMGRGNGSSAISTLWIYVDPVWGATGLGWCVVALSSAVWGLFQFGTRRSAGAALIFSVVALGLTIVTAPAPVATGEPLRVVAIQPGTSLEQKWDPSQSKEIADRLWSMTADAAVRGADLVLWPEGAVPYRIDDDPAYREAVERMAGQFEIEIVLNSVASLDGGGFANSAFLATGEGVSPVRYDKVHLVPFGEFVPRWAQFAFTDSLVREVGAFTPGRQPVVLPARVPLAVAICFEVVFPDLATAQVRAGAQLLTTLTNDGWYGPPRPGAGSRELH